MPVQKRRTATSPELWGPSGTAGGVRPWTESEQGGEGALRNRALHLLQYCAALARPGSQATAPEGARPGRWHHDTPPKKRTLEIVATLHFKDTSDEKKNRRVVGCALLQRFCNSKTTCEKTQEEQTRVHAHGA